MRRLAVLIVAFVMAVSLAAPSGAVFAMESQVMTESAAENVLSENAQDTAVGKTEDTSELQVTTTAEQIKTNKTQVVVPVPQQPSSTVSEQQASIDTLEPLVDVLPVDYSQVKIAQVQVGVYGDAADEYISLYNNGNTPVDITGWCLKNKSNKNISCFNQVDTDFILQPNSYIATSFHERPQAGTLTTYTFAKNSIVGSNDKISLFDPKATLVDQIEWTSQKTGHYAIERLWDLGKFGALSDSWAWKEKLDNYGYINELVECENGSLVTDIGSCVDLPEEREFNQCSGLILNEIGANLADSEQFIEVKNISDSSLDIKGCKIMTNRNNKEYSFESVEIAAEEVFALKVAHTELTLTKTTKGAVYLISESGVEIDSVEYSSLAQGSSLSRIDDEWLVTYKTTFGSVNVHLPFIPCEDGYTRSEDTGRCNKIALLVTQSDCGEGRERNPATGRCRNISADSGLIPCREDQYRSEETNRCRNLDTSLSILKPCKEGQYRSEETNRCRSIASAASAQKPCAEDQFRNPETNRCKKIASTDELKDCGEGRERNPETNRCRNVLGASTSSDAPFAPEKVSQTAQSMLGWWAIGGASLLALSYAGWQWRFEVKRAIEKFGSVFTIKSK